MTALVDALEGRAPIVDLVVVGETTTALGRAVHDSRTVEPGDVFCCVVGANHDGHDHAPAAVAAGAAALVCERPLGLGVPELRVRSVRAAMGPVAAALVGHPSEHLEVVGITGTNGKTTVAHLLAATLEAAGRSCGIIGTLTGTRTTPEAPELQERLAALVAEGTGAVAMEVSSHALDLHRVDGTRFRLAVFTNLSRDHLDHHGDMASYFQAKARLFEPELCDGAVCNLDDPHGRLLVDAARVPTVGYSLADAEALVLGPHGSRFRWRGVEIELPLAGRFNVSNALAVATVAAELGLEPAEVARGLAGGSNVPGRFERVDVGQGFLAVVDYAHTPDGLEQVLTSVRELVDGRIIVVFGAGGDRDRSKRVHMGEVAARSGDVVVLTTDNPRSEPPAAIISEVRRGMEDDVDLRVEPDRRAAIALAVSEAADGDVVVVAGKGHETTQIIGDDVRPFDDREELRSALLALGGGV